MAKNRPPLQIGDLTKNLKDSKGQGIGAFFTPPPRGSNAADPKENAVTPHQRTTPTQPKIAPKTERKALQTPSKEINRDVVTSPLQDVNLREWRDLIENTETHNSSLRMTREEVFQVEDLLTEIKRNLKIKSSLNEVARLGLLYTLKDFMKNKEKSLIVKVKKS